jgi:hypothetical protein
MSKKPAAPLPPCNLEKDRKEIYRDTTLGKALKETLEELMQRGRIDKKLAASALCHFDTHSAAIMSRAAPRLKFKTMEVQRFTEVDKSYNFLLSSTELSFSLFGGRDCANIGNIDFVSAHIFKLQFKYASNKINVGQYCS